MRSLTLATFTLLMLFRCTLAYPPLAQTQENKAVYKDLQQLTLAYEQCHMHIVLFNGKVDLHGIRSPYAVSRIQVNYPIFETTRVGVLAVPQMRHMIDPCQATFQVLPSKIQFDQLVKDDRFYAFETRGRMMRPDEGALAWYILKQRYSFLVVNYEASGQLSDKTSFAEMGGNHFVVLKYQVRKGREMEAYTTLESVTTVCEHCLRHNRTKICSDVSECLRLVGQAHQEMEDDGRNVNWIVQRSAKLHGTGRRNPGHYYCIRLKQAQYGRCTQSLEAAFLNYITGSLNESVTGIPESGQSRPIISWSEDSLVLEDFGSIHLLPLNFYPMVHPNESVTSLKFITADGVNRRVPYYAVCTAPLDLGTWVGALGLFFILLSLVTATTKSDKPEVPAGNIMRWGLFWVYSVLLDQVEFPRVRRARVGFRALISSLLVVTFVLTCSGNIYSHPCEAFTLGCFNLFSLTGR